MQTQTLERQPTQTPDRARAQRRRALRATAPLDLYESTNAWALVLDIPGVSPDGLELTLERGVLQIRGTRPQPDGQLVWGSPPVAAWVRAVRVPDGVDPDQVEATVRDGVLTVTLPKAPELQPRRIAVQG